MAANTNTAIKDTARHGIVYGIGQLVPQLTGFVLLPLFTKYLTPSDFGVWSLLQSVSILAVTIFLVGLDTACMRSFYDYDDDEKRKVVVGSTVILVSFMVLLLYIAGFTSDRTLSELVFKSRDYSRHIHLVVILSGVRILNSIPYIVFRATNRSKTYILIQSVSAVARFVLMIVFLFLFEQKVVSLLYADISVTTLSSAFLYLTVRSDIKLKLDLGEAKKMMLYGLPLAPGQISSSVFEIADRYFLSAYASLSAVGVYSVGIKLSQAVPLLLSRPFQLIFPAVAFSLHKDSGYLDYCKKIFTYYSLIGIFICLSIGIFSREILSLLGRREYLAVENIIPFLLLSYFFHGVQQNLQIGIFVERKTHWFPIIIGTGCALNILLNWLLIKDLQIYGCAIAKILSKLIIVLLWYFLSKKFMNIRYEWVRIIKIAAAASIVYALSRWIKFDILIASIFFKIFLLVLFPLALYSVSFFVPDEKAKIKSIYRKATHASLKLIFSR